MRNKKNDAGSGVHESQMRYKAYKIYQAMEGIDDSLIVQADVESGKEANEIWRIEKPYPVKRQWLKWGGALAAGVLLAAILIIPRVLPSPFRTVEAPFVNGVQVVSLKKLNVQNEGIQGLEQTLRRYVHMPEKLNIAYLSAQVSSKGIIEDFDLLLYSFDTDNTYKGKYRFLYTYEKSQMNFSTDTQEGIVPEEKAVPIFYNENNDVSYISEQIKRIPLKQQIALLDFSEFVVHFRCNTQITPNHSIIDGIQNNEIPVMSLNEYRSGQGGKSDSNPAVYVTLYDGRNLAGENAIIYKLSLLTASLGTAKNSRMPCDYHINANKMKVTRDYGETWIDVDIPEEEMQETMDFYGSYHAIPENSYYISPEPGGVIAVIYGKTPKLRLSQDDGATWQTLPFNLQNTPEESVGDLPMITRIIGFTSDKEGYGALGSGWSAETGEMKFAYFTQDGGVSWIRKGVPFSGSNRLLTGMSFADTSHGILSLQNPLGSTNAVAPILFYTNDGGENWHQTVLPEEEILKEVERGEVFIGSVAKVDSLTYTHGVYTLICGKGSDNYIKAKFQSRQLNGPWELVERYRALLGGSQGNS
ncbi:MAG: hypothetical protein FWG14_08770 [Peptococcaceae bacterium]|nr:hypothetical protein [Peptococcaceae bacterium]